MAMPLRQGQVASHNFTRYSQAAPSMASNPFDMMKKKHGMSSAVGRGFCNQLFSPDKPVENLYLPGNATYVIDKPNDYVNSITGGMLVSLRQELTVTIGTAGAGFLLVSCDDTGYNGSSDASFSLATWAGSALPTTGAAGISSTDSIALTPWSRPSVYGDTFAIVVGQRIRVKSNSAASSARKGKYICGWIPQNDGLTYAQLTALPAFTSYDASLLTAADQAEFYRPPYAIGVNNKISTDSGSMANARLGFLFLLAQGMTTNDQLTLEVTTLVFYYGEKILNDTQPIFTTAGYECALTCWGRVFGRRAAILTSERGKAIAAFHSESAGHNMHHSPSSFLSNAWESVKSLGQKAWNWISPHLPGLVASFL